MVEKTLDSMYRGGIYDHIGFGFARYSTDRQWLVPHFEKMLYDNALLTIAYLEACQITRRPEYARIAREVLTYVLGNMTSEEGGFYSCLLYTSLASVERSKPEIQPIVGFINKSIELGDSLA